MLATLAAGCPTFRGFRKVGIQSRWATHPQSYMGRYMIRVQHYALHEHSHLQKIGDQFLAFSCQYALRMKLHAFDGIFAMTKSHDGS